MDRYMGGGGGRVGLGWVIIKHDVLQEISPLFENNDLETT